MSKLLFLDIESAFSRAVAGESVRKIARDLDVTEGALRYHFRKGAPPREVRRLAIDLFHAQRRRDMLCKDDRQAVDRMVRKKAADEQVTGNV